MCTRQYMRIKGVSCYTPEFAFIPCGECEECRQLMRSEWSTRLRCELDSLVDSDWWLGFVTLTYSNQYLPHLPRVLLHPEFAHLQNDNPQCFSREHCKDFICDVRQYVKRKYDCVARKDDNGVLIQDDRPRYLLACEYGDSTKRCHYHLLLAFPPRVPQREMFDYIHQRWTFGHVFPRYFDGGVDSHGYEHKPFVVASVGAACSYCAKYVCKDLAYAETFRRGMYQDKIEIPENEFCGAATVRLRDYLPFHMQSRSLGLRFVQKMKDSEKLDSLLNGLSFVGIDKRVHLPKYMSNKILYNVYYPKDKDGKRLSRRFNTDFFERYKSILFEKKVDGVAGLVDDFKNPRKFVLHKSNQYGEDIKQRYSDLVKYFSDFSSRDLARFSLAWYGVNKAFCKDVEPLNQWFSKYQAIDNGVEVEEVDLMAPELPIAFTSKLNDFFDMLYLNRKVSCRLADKLALSNVREIGRVHDYYAHCG